MTALVSPDRFTRHALLGFAFRDASDGSAVGDGLAIRLSDAAFPTRFVTLVPTPSGTWTSPCLPGIGIELAGRPEQWPAQARLFQVEVEDLLDRYLPARFVAALPARGRFAWPSWAGFDPARIRPLLPANPPADFEPDFLPLFPSIARTPPGARATVRAHLAFRLADGSDLAAGWAAMTVSVGGQVVGLGIADAGGAVAASFPYPDLPSQTPEEAQEGRSQVTWEAILEVHHGGLAGDPPDLADILGQLSQPATKALSTLEPAAPALPPQTLVLGRPLTAATMRDATRRFSTLYLETA